MDWSELTKNIREIWEYKPKIVILFVLGFVIFVLLVVDTRKFRRHRKKRR